jgi:hypothetical protein
MNETEITIPRRFTGIHGFVQGGYVCGVVASHLSGTADISMKLPTPVEKALLLRCEGDLVQLFDEDRLLVEAKPGELSMQSPPVPDWETCAKASSGYPGHRFHFAPECFVCGTHVPDGRGLDIFPGPVPGSNLYAAAWEPDANTPAAKGHVTGEVVWGVMDCISGWPVVERLPAPENGMLMGRFVGRVFRAPSVGQRCRLIGWVHASEGRKHSTSMCMVAENSEVMAQAQALWIALKPRA